MFPNTGIVEGAPKGELEVPLRTSEIVESFYGARSIGDGKSVDFRPRDVMWSCRYTNNEIILDNGTVGLNVLYVENVRELSVCFDSRMMPVIAYQVDETFYLRHYDINLKDYVIKNLTELYPEKVYNARVAFDDRRSQFRIQGSVIVGFITSKELRILTSDDQYLTAIRVKTFKDNLNYLNQIAMADNNRLHFVVYRYSE